MICLERGTKKALKGLHFELYIKMDDMRLPLKGSQNISTDGYRS